MNGSILTPKEEKIIKELLFKKGITYYTVFWPVPEGRDIFGSTEEMDLESLSGTIITPDAVYSFWLDWVDGHYTLGEDKEVWKKLIPEEYVDEEVIHVQQSMRDNL